MLEENKRIARAYFEALDAEKSPPASICTPDFVLHIAGNPDMDMATAKTFTKDLVAAVPDLSHPIVELVAEGDKVCYRGRYEGTQTGSYLGAAQTSGQLSATGMGMLRIADGKVAEVWIWPDTMTVMQQLGVLPPQS
ncbi:ester cyclase [Phytohabitans sp. ZYX-F-186]|uniref:Ester cyclase n=1 Tax=Phytohabitans maris TaxID=3071409 RepID=A0ABU0ZS63_9ACTN|nr:ester cyclase [Phytohabitans sp. ZYX-F-186]MDQ7909870.1 ester cyclase [Phytohabitans sp. ZYX-F-186]